MYNNLNNAYIIANYIKKGHSHINFLSTFFVINNYQ